MRGALSTHPTQIWSHLSPECRQQITDELLSIFQEGIHACVYEQQEHIRTDHSPPPPKEGSDLRPAIHPNPGDDQSGKPALAIRARTARSELGLEAGRY